MKEFIEKLIGRLEERQNTWAVRGTEFSFAGGKRIIDERAFGTSEGLSEAILIVNQLAEEYKSFGNSEQVNNAWIPCSERLPEENGYYLITIKFYHLHNEITMGCFFDDGEWFKVDKDDKVLAWQLLPAPYTENKVSEMPTGWKQNVMERFEKVE